MHLDKKNRLQRKGETVIIFRKYDPLYFGIVYNSDE